MPFLSPKNIYLREDTFTKKDYIVQRWTFDTGGVVAMTKKKKGRGSKRVHPSLRSAGSTEKYPNFSRCRALSIFLRTSVFPSSLLMCPAGISICQSDHCPSRPRPNLSSHLRSFLSFL